MNLRPASSFPARAQADDPVPPVPGRSRRARAAFTLIEVMIAMGIFFMAIFAILELVSECLRNARLIQREHIDNTPVMTAIYSTNKMVEGTDSGEFEGTDFKWETEIHPDDTQGSNGLWHVQAVISDRTGASETNWALRWADPPPLNGVH